MAHIEFASSIVRHSPVAPLEIDGETVGELLGEVFMMHPSLKGYVLDDQGAVRKHVTIFVNDRTISDRLFLTDPVGKSDQIYVFQALSGG